MLIRKSSGMMPESKITISFSKDQRLLLITSNSFHRHNENVQIKIFVQKVINFLNILNSWTSSIRQTTGYRASSPSSLFFFFGLLKVILKESKSSSPWHFDDHALKFLRFHNFYGGNLTAPRGSDANQCRKNRSLEVLIISGFRISKFLIWISSFLKLN